MTAQRKNDNTLILRQNNDVGAVTVIDVDDEFAELCGSSREALINTPFFDMLGAKTYDYLTDAVEFVPDGIDLAEACQKVREFRFKDGHGGELVRPFRTERIDSPDGHAWFRLIVAGEEQRALRELLSQSLQAHFDGQAATAPDTGLPTGEAAEGYLEMLRNVMPANGMDACCALLRVDRFEKSLARYGKSGALHLLNHVANCCKATFRSDDMVCQLDDHTLAMFLVDISHDSAKVVLNRLRWNIHTHRIAFGGKEDFSVTVSIAFGSVLTPGGSILARCKAMLDALPSDERSQLIDVAA